MFLLKYYCIKKGFNLTKKYAICAWNKNYPLLKICQLVVLLLDGSSDIGVHVKSNLCYLIFFKAFD